MMAARLLVLAIVVITASVVHHCVSGHMLSLEDDLAKSAAAEKPQDPAPDNTYVVVENKNRLIVRDDRHKTSALFYPRRTMKDIIHDSFKFLMAVMQKTFYFILEEAKQFYLMHREQPDSDFVEFTILSLLHGFDRVLHHTKEMREKQVPSAVTDDFVEFTSLSMLHGLDRVLHHAKEMREKQVPSSVKEDLNWMHQYFP